MDYTVPTPRPGDDELDDDQDDGSAGPSAFATPAPNPVIRDLIEFVHGQGFRIYRSGSDEWRIPCPHHPSLGIAWNPNTVPLEQRPNDTVWVHPPTGARSCSCTARQVIAGYRWTDPRIVPAGTVVTEAALRELMATSVRESYGAITWDDSPTGAGDWLDEPLIEKGQFTSIYGPAGIGKSLLAQDRAAHLSRIGHRVLYLDAENPLSEIKARLRDMDYSAADLANLTYLSFPSLPPLDAPAGAAKLATLVDAIDPQLIVLDTWSKFLAGDEASPSTHTAAYNLSIVPLRRRGVAIQAIDHSGKDPARGPRGGSSKVDNVDTLWLVTAKSGGRLRLERRKSRTGRGPDLIELDRRTGPLRHERLDLAPADVLSPEVRECIAKLDELEVPAGWGRDRASDVLRANDYRVRNETLSASLRVRKERGAAHVDSLDLSPGLGDSAGQVNFEDPGTGRGQVTE